MNSQIKLLKKQIAKLEEKDFDLEVWKISTALILEKIIGKESSEIKQINSISGDMSSWTLRDNLGDIKSDRSKLLGKQILETCIDEIELSNEISEKTEVNEIMLILKNEVKGSLFEEINKKKAEKSTQTVKIKKLQLIFNKLDKKELASLLSIIFART